MCKPRHSYATKWEFTYNLSGWSLWSVINNSQQFYCPTFAVRKECMDLYKEIISKDVLQCCF